MATGTLAEVWAALVDELTADAQLQQLGLTSDAVIYHEGGDLPRAVQDPSVVITVLDDGPDTQLNVGRARYQARLQIDIVGTRAAQRRAILERIDELLETPRVRTQPVETATFRVTRLVRRNAIPVDTPLVEDGRRLVQLVTEWTAVVDRKAV